MAVTNVNGITVNKITKSQYDAEVLAGNITSAMQQNEVWIFTDDQHVSSSEKANWNAKSDFSGNYNDLTNKPELFSGSYNDLSDKPVIPDVSNLETKSDASAKLTEAKAYTDTKVADLVGTAPTTLDTLAEVATAIEENESVVEALNAAIGNKANASDLSAVATSGSYNDLSDKPVIPTVPTNVSAFTNDAGYLTSIPSDYVTNQYLIQALANYVADSELADVAKTGSYNDLSNKPTIPTAVTKIWE